MDSVDSMRNLVRIFKKKKALTRISLGVIIGASVIALILIIMAAVVPFFSRDVSMFIRKDDIDPISGDNQMGLEFRVTCDYAAGHLYTIEIYKDDTLYGVNEAISMDFNKSQEREVVIESFTATGAVPSEQVNGSVLLFQYSEEYTLTLWYEESDGSPTELQYSRSFVFNY